MSYKNQLEENKKWSIISEEDLNEIYEFQYNDIFPKILLLDSTQFMNVLEKQIIIDLFLLKKQPILSSLQKISEYYILKYYKDREKVFQAFQIIKHMNINELEFLDKLNCYIHCPNCSMALHTCGNKFILCNDYIFCLQCKKVYNEYQAKMYCDFCKLEYYTKLREITEEDYENYFPVCLLSKEQEMIKCKNCNENLYLNIDNINKINTSEKSTNLFCKKCKMNFNNYNMKEIKLFNEFTKDKIDKLCIIHTLLKRKFANPKGIKKYCLCDLPNNIKYKHSNDNGNLLEGFRQGKKIILCDKCFQIFEYKNYKNWICPECGLGFNEKNNGNIHTKYNTAISSNKMKSIFLNKKIEKEKENSKNNSNINNNINNNHHHRYNNNLKDSRKNSNINKINTNESLEQMNKINNNNIRTSIINLNKENSNINDSMNNSNNNKSKRIISSKLLSQENRIKRNSNNYSVTNSNSNLVESKYISKKNNSKNQKKNTKEQINKNNNVIKIDFGKINNSTNNNNNLITAKSSINIHSNENKNIQMKNNNEKNKNNINMKSSNSNVKIEIIKRNYSLDKNKDEKNNNKKRNIINNNGNNIINNNNSNKNIRIKFNNEKNDNKNFADKVIQRNNGSPNHKRVDIVETRLNKNNNNNNNNINKNKINNIQSINIKFSHDFDNIKYSNNNYNLNLNSNNNKEVKESRPLYKSINIINNNENKNQIDNMNNIYIKDKSKDKDKEKESTKPKKENTKEEERKETTKEKSKEKEKEQIKNDTSKNISSEGYQFNSDNYNVVQLLGEGTFGKIYLVEDPDDFKKYALKKISVSDMEELSDNKREFELLMKLSQENPSLNVVKIFGIQVKKLDKFNLVMYVLMEAAQCDWENEIRNRSQYQAYYTEEELMKILLNLSTTLASLQKMGICHRDVKPQNILCFGKDNYKLSDFGEAKKKKKRKINGNFIYDFEGDTSKQTVRGTELYMSPILFKALHDCPEIDLEYNAYKSDVFSLGLCMLLSSTLGFQALYDIRELYDNNKIKKIVEKYLSPRYSKDYVKLIISMLQIKEKNRPDFIELQNNIQQIYYHKNSKDNKDK